MPPPRRPLRFIVTGSDTDAGKTYLSCALLRAWRANGRTLSVLKPVLTGYDAQTSEISDPALLLQAAGLPADRAHIEAAAPLRYRAPQSPDVAAFMENLPPPTAKAIADAAERAAADLPEDGVLLIEGAGGAMVPLNPYETLRDAFALISAPLIFAAPCRLGGLSACLTGIEAARAKGLHIVAVGMTCPPARQAETPAEAFRRSLSPHLGTIPLFHVETESLGMAAYVMERGAELFL